MTAPVKTILTLQPDGSYMEELASTLAARRLLDALGSAGHDEARRRASLRVVSSLIGVRESTLENLGLVAQLATALSSHVKV